MLTCCDCNQHKCAAEFYVSANGRPFRRCRACTVIRQRGKRHERQERLGVHDEFSSLAHRFISQRTPT